MLLLKYRVFKNNFDKWPLQRDEANCADMEKKKYSEKDMLDAIQVDQGGQCDRNRETMSYRSTGKRGQ